MITEVWIMHRNRRKRFTAYLLSVLMTLNAVPVTSFAQEVPKTIPEDSIQEESLLDGMF